MFEVPVSNEPAQEGKRVRFPHDRVTVKRSRNVDLGMRIEANPKSKIYDPKSNKSGRLPRTMPVEMFRVKASQADTVF